MEFRDLHLNTRAHFGIARIPEKNMTVLSLDQDVEGTGVLGAGDCEIGLDRGNTRLLLTFAQRSKAIPLTETPLWLLVGRAEFSWSDQSESDEDDRGSVYVESNGAEARMIIQPNAGAWMPYVATFSFASVDELSALLSRALPEP